MPRNVYSEINLHFVWHCKNSANLIKELTQPKIHDCIRGRVQATPDVFFHALGGIGNHVHLAVSIPPTLEISQWIGAIKGGSSHDINEAIAILDHSFEWQTGYGVLSFGTKDLPWVVRYIQNQKTHHDQDTWEERLERIEIREA